MAIVLSGTTGIDAGSLPVANTGKISAGTGLPVILNTAGVDRVIVDVNGDVRLASSPAQFDNDTSIATTAFVQSALGSFKSVIGISVSTSLDASFIGKFVTFFGSGNRTATLPKSDTSIPDGGSIAFLSTASGSVIAAASGDVIRISGNNTPTSIPLGDGDIAILTKAAVGWVLNGTLSSKYAENGHGINSQTSSGYQKLPSGLIIQWGIKQINNTAINTLFSTPVTFPITFPNACLRVLSTLSNTPQAYANVSSESASTSGYTIISAAGQTGLINVCFLAIGY